MMSSRRVFITLITSGLLALLFVASSQAAILDGKVVGVADGDTVTVLDVGKQQHKIRLMGIDAPEKRMPYGERSKQSLSRLVYGKIVAVEYSKRDRYQRIVGKVIVDGADANLAQIRAGMAWHYKQYEREQTLKDARRYSQAEEEARRSRQGLWKDTAPVPPWEWRQEQRAK